MDTIYTTNPDKFWQDANRLSYKRVDGNAVDSNHITFAYNQYIEILHSQFLITVIRRQQEGNSYHIDRWLERRYGSAAGFENNVILKSLKDWSLLVNDAWLLASIHLRRNFVVSEEMVWENFWNKNRMTVTAREIIGIMSAGYTFTINPDDGKLWGRPDNHSGMAQYLATVEKKVSTEQTSLLTYMRYLHQYRDQDALRWFFDKICRYGTIVNS